MVSLGVQFEVQPIMAVSRNVRQLVTACPQSGRQTERSTVTQLAFQFFIQAKAPTHNSGATHIK